MLYINYGCPWAHRTNIVRSLKGLEDVIQLSVMDPTLTDEGWVWSGRFGTEEKDPVYGFTKLKQLYLKADLTYTGRFLVPMLWDKQKETIVSNESSEIIRMFYEEFDEFVQPELREERKPLLPKELKADIEQMNEWVYDLINNGVYKTGFATTQAAYEANLHPLFDGLARLEKHLSDRKARGLKGPYLFGEQVTEADIRLYPTLARFDVAYYLIFKCNLGMIRYDFPELHQWLRTLYWDESRETNFGAFKKTTVFSQVRLPPGSLLCVHPFTPHGSVLIVWRVPAEMGL